MYFPRTSSFGHHQALGNGPGMTGVDAGGNFPLLALMYINMAVEIWRMLLEHCTVAAARRALLSAGSRIPTSTAMIPITTNSSTSVKPAFLLRVRLKQHFFTTTSTTNR